MSLVLTCPGCGTRLKVPNDAVGKSAKCPKCAKVVGIPTAEEPLPQLPPRIADPPKEDRNEEDDSQRKRRKRRDFEEDEDERSEQPKRQRRRRQMEEDEDEPTSRKGLKTTTIAMIVGGSVAFFSCLTIGIALVSWHPSHSSRTTEQTNEDVWELGDKEIVDFIDHPERFKGKTLRIKLMLESIRGEPGDMLRDHRGQQVPFHISARSGSSTVSIMMPMTGELPNARVFNHLIVTFVCSEGMLQSGNEAIKVERP